MHYTNFIYAAKLNNRFASTRDVHSSCVQDLCENLFKKIQVKLKKCQDFSPRLFLDNHL